MQCSVQYSVFSFMQVQPNSQLMKAIQVIFKRPGVTAAKACIRCAGPDWPVSVICGMLKLSYWQTSLGLGPMFCFTIPAVLAGAFMTKTAASGFGGLDTIAMVVLLLMNAIFSLGLVTLTNKVIADFDRTSHENLPLPLPWCPSLLTARGSVTLVGHHAREGRSCGHT